MAGPEIVSDSPSRIAELILSAREGSDAALGELMQFSRQYLLVIANDQLPGDLQAKGGASDLVQETHFEAVREFGRFRGHSAAELLGWLREILLHNLQDFSRRYTGTAMRRVELERSLSEPDSGPDLAGQLAAEQSSPSSQLQREQEARLVEDAVQGLPEDFRQVVLWHHRDGVSFEEIGARLGRSAGAVRKLWTRAILQLQSRLKPSNE